MKKVLSIALLALSLTACSRQELPSPPEAATAAAGETVTSPWTNKSFEHRVEAFSKPDKYGVVCYHYLYGDQSLSCIKVQ